VGHVETINDFAPDAPRPRRERQATTISRVFHAVAMRSAAPNASGENDRRTEIEQGSPIIISDR
jgi:hypothetical protein